MTYRGPNRSLILPPHTNDIFDANYHPDLDALSELRFQAYKEPEIGPKIQDPQTHTDTNANARHIGLGLLIGVLVLSYLMFQFIMMLGY
jgi:hypothetical protein